MSAPKFLSVDDVLRLHALAIEDQGGDAGIRDRGLLESACAMPMQQFGGEYLHADIPTMAAAYAFHICKNHPFIDGNKRAATAAMIVFLLDNGWSFDATANVAEPAIVRLAAGQFEKSDFTEWLRINSHEKSKMELREFFLSLTWNKLFQFADSAIANSRKEFAATADEAATMLPVIQELRDLYLAAVKQGNHSVATNLIGQMQLLASMFRIAEDMGYEW